MKNENEAVNSKLATERFTGFPNLVVEFMLLGELKLLEMKLLILVIRLTYGCHREWVELIQADLIAADIASNRAKDVLTSALSKGVLIRDGQSNRYKAGSRFLISYERGQNRLDQLIHQQLSGSSQKRNIEVPEIGTIVLPKEEDDSYQNGNTEVYLKQEHLRVIRPKIRQPKDRLKKVFKESVKETNARKSIFSPYDYKPHNGIEVAAQTAWRHLDHDNPECFGVYLSFVKRGLPSEAFYELTQAVLEDSAIKNKGAMFNKLASRYLENCTQEGGIANG